MINNAIINEVIFCKESIEFTLNISMVGNSLMIPISHSQATTILASFKESKRYELDMTSNEGFIFYQPIYKTDKEK